MASIPALLGAAALGTYAYRQYRLGRLANNFVKHYSGGSPAEMILRSGATSKGSYAPLIARHTRTRNTHWGRVVPAAQAALASGTWGLMRPGYTAHPPSFPSFFSSRPTSRRPLGARHHALFYKSLGRFRAKARCFKFRRYRKSSRVNGQRSYSKKKDTSCLFH